MRSSETAGQRAVTARLGALVLGLGLVACAGRAEAARYEDPQLGYSVEVPSGWRHRFDEDLQVLWMAAPDGYRVRLDAQRHRSALGKAEIVEAYRSDGRGLKARYGRLKVRVKPSRDGRFGSRPSFTFGFLYRAETGEVEQADTWLASGAARDPDRHLHVQLRAHGPRDRFRANEAALARIRGSFRFPTPEVEVQPEPEASRSAASVLALVAEPAADPGPTLASPSSGGSGGRRGGGGGSSGAVRPGHVAGARAYDRGSLSGGAGFMKDAAVITDQRRVDMMKKAFSVGNGTRTEEQKKRAAKYLGFDL